MEMQVSKVKILEAEKKRLAFDEVSRAQIVRAVASPKVILLLSLCAPVFLAGAPPPPLLPPLQIPSFSLKIDFLQRINLRFDSKFNQILKLGRLPIAIS